MVPENSPPPDGLRELSPETVQSLREVITERWAALENSEERLRAALRTATAEAKARGVRPEELIVVLKRLEHEVFARPGTVRATDHEARRRFREWLVSTCLENYFDNPS